MLSALSGPRWLAAVFVLALALLVATGGGTTSPTPAHATGPTDSILVQFKAPASPQAIAALNASNAVEQVDAIPALGIRVLRVAPGQDPADVAERYNRHPLVEFAEVNANIAPADVPNDPHYGSAWHLPKIDASGAWAETKANGVLIAICDTGVEADHPDLAPVLRGDLGWNTASNNDDWSPIASHGTLVSGAAAAATNNATGVAGVAWGAEIIPVRITNQTNGSALVSDAAKCITYAADNGASAINLSYRMARYSTISNAGDYAKGKGALTFVAAGNDGIDPDWPKLPGFLAVAATTSSDTKASWSNYGDYVDIAAPGASIWTTRANGGYGTASGTSLASPVAAGVAALVFGASPTLGPSEVESILLASADDIGSSYQLGAGRVNAAAAVAMAGGGSEPEPESTPEPTPEPAPEPEPTPEPDTTPPTVSITSPDEGATVEGTVWVIVSATDDVGVTKVELYVNGTLHGTKTGTPYDFTWDSTTVADGSHTLTARAFDDAGNVGQATRNVTVANVVEDQPIETVFSGSVGGNGRNHAISETHTVNVTVEGPMGVDLSWGGNASLTVTVLDASGEVVMDGSGPASISATSGTYTFVVTSLDRRANYTLTVSHY
jgi:thermitase